MSTSELFLVENDPKRIEIEFCLGPVLELSDGSQIAISKDVELHRHQEEEEEEEQLLLKEEEEKEERWKTTETFKKFEKPSLEEFKIEEDDDGYLTPTSLDHKIPVNTQCPPAPRKPKALPCLKRKASLRIGKLIVLDEIEGLLPPFPLTEISRRIKKAREDDTKW